MIIIKKLIEGSYKDTCIHNKEEKSKILRLLEDGNVAIRHRIEKVHYIESVKGKDIHIQKFC